jgi:wyosine [tRNA(Phe)-imidazoG37] synthetase (radical SAM superfamily)
MTDAPLPLHKRHPRSFRKNKFVYPVLSRRSKGISLGVNLNPDKICNFDCIYCQVDRHTEAGTQEAETQEAETQFVEMERLLEELDTMLAFVNRGEIYEDESFREIPASLRRLNDIAFSGDGEPTTYRNFDAIVNAVAGLRRMHHLNQTKLVLITNASMFHRPAVQRALETLDGNNGEIWAKLETGTQEYYQLVERTKIPFQRIMDNITYAAQVRPLVIQSLFMRINDERPPDAEIGAFCDRLNEITGSGGRIQLVQVYTVARPPAESFVARLTPPEVDSIAERVVHQTNLPTEVYYG